MSHLLTIDMDAALRKLSVGRLKSPDHVPLAVVRSLAKLNPSRINAKITKNGFAIECTGGTYPAGMLRAMATLLDTAADSASRRRALDWIESVGQLDLLVAFYSGAKKTTWHSRAQQKGIEKTGDTTKIFSIQGIRHERIEYRLPTKRWKEQIAELARHLRFAHFEFLLNGKVLPSGKRIPDTIFGVEFDDGNVSGALGIPSFGLAARTYLVTDGILQQEVWESPLDGAIWEGLVYFDSEHAAEALASVHDKLSMLYASLKRFYTHLPDEHRQRVREIFFRMATQNPASDLLSGVEMFQNFSGRALTVEQVLQMSENNSRSLETVNPDESFHKYIMNDDVLILDEMQREFLENNYGLKFSEPQRKPSKHFSISSLFQVITKAWSFMKTAASGLFSPSIVHESELSAPERRLVQRLGQVMNLDHSCERGSCEVAFVKSGLQAWRWVKEDGNEKKVLALKRSHPLVKKMLLALEAEPMAILPIVMLLWSETEAQALSPLLQNLLTELRG